MPAARILAKAVIKAEDNLAFACSFQAPAACDVDSRCAPPFAPHTTDAYKMETFPEFGSFVHDLNSFDNCGYYYMVDSVEPKTMAPRQQQRQPTPGAHVCADVVVTQQYTSDSCRCSVEPSLLRHSCEQHDSNYDRRQHYSKPPLPPLLAHR